MNLRLHNILWSRYLKVWHQYAGGGWWGRGSIVSPEMRGFYEKFLPFNEFKHSLITIGEQILESPDWVPNILRSNDILSLPDFWAMLPDAFAGRVTFKEDELFPLFCAIADPSRFGTSNNRYPAQLQQIGDFVKRTGQGRAVRLLDIGCGVGLGTYELAAATGGNVVGITSEHLEVWMASHRRLPHDDVRERLFHRYPPILPVTFVQGFAESYHDGTQYDVIVCNGLAGGRFLNANDKLAAFLESCGQLLAPHGRMFAANRFHEGERLGVERLRAIARQSGWSVEGHWKSLIFSRTR
ncbi:MAG: class I SAM-dependent methyltransferase [Victivallales bacterium]|nr:class I SAM-dependent methyltransferase [Victivallales bacterium]